MFLRYIIKLKAWEPRSLQPLLHFEDLLHHGHIFQYRHLTFTGLCTELEEHVVKLPPGLVNITYGTKTSVQSWKQGCTCYIYYLVFYLSYFISIPRQTLEIHT